MHPPDPPAGEDEELALVERVRAIARSQDIPGARAAVRAAREGGTARGARAAAAVIAAELARYDTVAERLAKLPADAVRRLVPAEAAAVELAAGGSPDPGVTESLTPGAALDLARHALGAERLGLAERALARAASADGPADVVAEVEWLERWLPRFQRAPRAAQTGAVSVAVLGYELPDFRRVSTNVGDFVQTLASLGHLLRHDGIRLTGEPGLVAELEALRADVCEERRVPGPGGEVNVVAANRDASSLDELPEGTWMLAFGWYMHAWFRARYDFPFNPALRPIFVSFHVSREELLSPAAVAYLAEHGPVGCRDWTTVRRLLGLGVPAFFSGCLTTTLDLVFPEHVPAPPADAPVALVEVDAETAAAFGNGVASTHSDPAVRMAGLTENLRRARDILAAYRSDYSAVATSRLHCYLPARALGVEATFHPRDSADPRYEGLIGVDDGAFTAIGRGITGKLEPTIAAILAGADEATVRSVWAEACAPAVTEARERGS